MAPIANRTAWLVLLGLLPDPPSPFASQRQPIFDSLSRSFTSFREFLSDARVQLDANLAVILSQIISAALITFLFNSFDQDELPFGWGFLARLK
jgi:hypothetical protein